jgi:hypothetical protein
MCVTDPIEPARPTAGVDWAQHDHAVAIVDADGGQTRRFPVAHDAAGLRTLVRDLLAADVAASGSNGAGCARCWPTPNPPPRCARPSEPAATWWRTESRSPTNCADRHGALQRILNHDQPAAA